MSMTFKVQLFISDQRPFQGGHTILREFVIGSNVISAQTMNNKSKDFLTRMVLK